MGFLVFWLSERVPALFLCLEILIAGPRRGPIQLIEKNTMAQLPAGAEGAAAGVLVWSFTCLLANILLQWLLWTGHERRSCQFFHPIFFLQKPQCQKINLRIECMLTQ